VREGGHFQETGDRRQETGDRRQETGDSAGVLLDGFSRAVTCLLPTVS
jgi:hypothetical protein